MSTKKFRYWGFIAYPDSAPDNWLDILRETGLPIAISPLHDKDQDPTEEEKKPHWHVILAFSGPTTASVVNDVVASVHGAQAIRLLSVKGMYRYHLHLDNPEKHQYDDSDRILLNGFNIEDIAGLSASEMIQVSKMIIQFIEDNDITEFTDLCHLTALWDQTAYGFVLTHTLFTNTYLNSRRNKRKQQKAAGWCAKKKDPDE